MDCGFFSSEIISSKHPISSIPRCGVCKLCRDCTSPKMKPTGKGKKKILVVAEAPGEQEDSEGIQLVGKSGKKFREILSKLGVDLDRDCWKTNSIICHPEGNKTPTDEQIDSCRPNLLRTIKELNPHTIILLGGIAVKSLIGYLWRGDEDTGGITRWVGWTIPSQELNAWVVPNFHPAFLLRTNDPVLELWFTRYLRRAISLGKPPWPDRSAVPDYGKQIKKFYDSDEAARWLRCVFQAGGMVAFDYETDRLKPDHKESKIISCAVCWEGKETGAFLWRGAAVQAMSEILLSEKIRKIAANMKFEERWTRAVLGHHVWGWEWDTMLAAHGLDHRSGITGVKFQSFVQLGQSAYDAKIHPYLESKNSNTPNRIHQVHVEDLLQYNGMDAILEWHLFCRQRQQLRDGVN